VLAPNTGDIRFQENAGYGYAELNTLSQGFLADHWYRMEVIWGLGGLLTGKLYDSDGTTLLNTVSATSNLYTSGGIAFRGFEDLKYFDTITREAGVPEPSTGALVVLGIGLGGLAGYRRRRAGR
jgi:hypothetical protein